MEIESWRSWTYLGGIPVVVSCIISAIWFFVSRRMLIKWKTSSNLHVEDFKGLIDKNKLFIENIIQSQFKLYLSVHEKRLIAIEKLWETFLKIKKAFPSSVFMIYTILDDTELSNLLSENSKMGNLIKHEDYFKIAMEISNMSEELDKYKIYIDPKLWSLFFVFRAISGRLPYFVSKEIKNGTLRHWHIDKPTKELLKSILSEIEYNSIYQMKDLSLSRTFDLLEFKILNEITELTTGSKQTEIYLNNLPKWNETVNSLRN